jgi:hypothetical protein
MIMVLFQFSKVTSLSCLSVENNQISEDNRYITKLSNGTIVEYYTDNIEKKYSFFYQIVIHL